MRKVIYDVAVSVDGFIAGHNGDVSMFPFEGAHADAYQARLATYDAVFMGKHTYEFGYQFGLAKGAKAYPHMTHYIFSRAISLPDNADVQVLQDDWQAAIQSIRQQHGSDIYLCGGGKLAGWMLERNLISELRLKRVPVTIGAGIRLFESTTSRAMHLQNVDVYDNGIVLEEYTMNDR